MSDNRFNLIRIPTAVRITAQTNTSRPTESGSATNRGVRGLREKRPLSGEFCITIRPENQDAWREDELRSSRSLRA